MELITSESGIKIDNMAKENKLGLMDHVTLGNSVMD